MQNMNIGVVLQGNIFKSCEDYKNIFSSMWPQANPNSNR